MIPTVYGVLVALICLSLMRRPPAVMLALVVVCSAFAGTSAIELPAVGGSSIQPALLCLGFLGIRLLRKDAHTNRFLTPAVTQNAWLLAFCLYGAATAFILPRLFAGQMNVIPMSLSRLGFRPLSPTSQNITTAVYLLGTGFTATAACIVAMRSSDVRPLVLGFLGVAWVHIGTGLLDAALTAVHLEYLLDIVRNGSYAQLSQSLGSVHRIAGITPEPSVYASLGGAYLVMASELWLRNVMPRATGAAAIGLAIMLVLTTSSTAYGLLGSYGLLLVVRALVFPGSVPPKRAFTLGIVALLAMMVGIGAFVLKPHLASTFASIISDMTINKGKSSSGVERAIWARQSLDALKVTHGIGIGAGSFRSSGLVSAILGSVGPAGLVVFSGYLLQVTKLFRPSSYWPRYGVRSDCGAAAGWAALMAMIPASLVSPSPDPGLVFAILAGLALGWRTPVRDADESPAANAGAQVTFASAEPPPAAQAARSSGGIITPRWSLQARRG